MKYLEFDICSRKTNLNMPDFHSHKHYELYFLKAGKRSLVFKDKKFNFTENSFAIIPPFTPHKTEGGPYTRINIYFSSDALSNDNGDSIFSTSTPIVYKLPQDYFETIYFLLQKAEENRSDDDKNFFDVKLKILNIIEFLLNTKELAIVESEAAVDKDKVIQNIVEYIKNNPSEKITIEMLCKKFFFTKSNLFRRFKLAMDCSISEYIYFVKIGLAKDLLYNTKKSIEEIAFLCGFSSLNYFSLMFKKKVGVSPANYRKTK